MSTKIGKLSLHPFHTYKYLLKMKAVFHISDFPSID